jgi:hypothetical protein
MRRECCICQTPLDGRGDIVNPSKVTSGYCPTCATNEHVKIDEMPACGLEGPWGVCDLFAGHAYDCRQLRDVSYRMLGAECGPVCQRQGEMR